VIRLPSAEIFQPPLPVLHQGEVGFEKLAEATGTQPKSLIRVFGPSGNPQARRFPGGLVGSQMHELFRASMPRYSSSAKLSGVAAVAKAAGNVGWLAAN
jgi:hypothetical protein